MERDKMHAYAAALLFVTAWFLPVEAYAARISDGILPGYQAFMVAISPVTLHRFNEIDLITLRELLTALSALSNLLMIFSLVVVLGWPRLHIPAPKRLSTALLFAFLINAQWIWPRGDEFLELQIGYWAWVASFGLAAMALRRLERRRRAGGAAPDVERRQGALATRPG